MSLKHLLLYLTIGISVPLSCLVGCSQQEVFEGETAESASITQAQAVRRDVPYVPTSNVVVEEMLKMANITANDVVYDLGSGDGRIVISAAQIYGARGVGIEIDPKLVQQAEANARQAGVSDRVKFIEQDLFEADLTQATVVTIYLLPHVNLRLRPKLLQELRPGTRVVSHSFHMGDWKPQKVVQAPGGSKLYYWVVPERQ